MYFAKAFLVTIFGLSAMTFAAPTEEATLDACQRDRNNYDFRQCEKFRDYKHDDRAALDRDRARIDRDRDRLANDRNRDQAYRDREKLQRDRDRLHNDKADLRHDTRRECANLHPRPDWCDRY